MGCIFAVDFDKRDEVAEAVNQWRATRFGSISRKPGRYSSVTAGAQMGASKKNHPKPRGSLPRRNLTDSGTALGDDTVHPISAAEHAVTAIRDLLADGEDRHAERGEGPSFPLSLFRPVARFLEECGLHQPGLEWVWPSGTRETLSPGKSKSGGSNGRVARIEVVRRAHGRRLRLGAVVFRDDRYDQGGREFQAALQTVCDAFADSVLRALEHAALRRRDAATGRIDHHCRQSRAGTAIARSLVVLAGLARSHHAFYATLDGTRLCVEYYVPSGWKKGRGSKIVAVPHPRHCSAELREALELRRTIEWSDARDELRNLSREQGLGCQLKCSYLLQPVYRYGDLVGVFALGVPEHTPILIDVYREPLDHAAQSLSQAAHFLFQRRFKELIVDPVFRSRDTRIDPEQVFVLMPFTLEWSERIWSRVLQPALEGLGLRAIRADDLYGRDVVEDIWAGIISSRFVVADITSRNPNVFYELGLAHTLGKDVILLTQEVEDIPFDLNRFRHIIYADNLDGYDVLRSGLVNSARHILEG